MLVFGAEQRGEWAMAPNLLPVCVEEGVTGTHRAVGSDGLKEYKLPFPTKNIHPLFLVGRGKHSHHSQLII